MFLDKCSINWEDFVLDPFEQAKADCLAITSAMKVATKPYLAGIYGSFPGGQHGNLIGSGVFIRFEGEVYVLTAGHNLTERDVRLPSGEKKYEALAVYAGNGESPQVPTGKLAVWKQPFDLGLAHVELPEGSSAIDVTQAVTLGGSKSYEKDVLFAHGLPGTRSAPYFGVHSKTMPHAAAHRPSKYDWYDPEIHVSIEFSPKDLFDETGAIADFEKPNGMSGCPIWRSGRSKKDSIDSWSPEDSWIIGIIHNWDDKAQCLLGTRVEHVQEFIRQAVATLKN